MWPFKRLAPVALTVDKARAERAKPMASARALAVSAPARRQPRHRFDHYRICKAQQANNCGCLQRLAKLSTPGQKHRCHDPRRQACKPYPADFSQRTHLTDDRATDKLGMLTGPGDLLLAKV